MSTYRLPAELGGAEVEASEQWGGCAGGRPEYQIGDITITMPKGTPMEQVAPPIPPEPTKLGAVVQIQLDAFWQPGNVLFQRFDSGWTEPGRDRDDAQFEYFTWAKVCSFGTPVLLVPAPPVVELPWTAEVESFGLDVRVIEIGRTPKVSIVVRSDVSAHGQAPDLTPAAARDMAYALLTAADEAEGRTHIYPPIRDCIQGGHRTNGETCSYGFCGRCGTHLDDNHCPKCGGETG